MSSKDEIMATAAKLGFAAVGITSAAELDRGADALAAWIAAGMHGEMGYMAGASDRAQPTMLLAEARSVITVALAYDGGDTASAAAAADQTLGFVARYARGDDYHAVIRKKIDQLAEACAVIYRRPIQYRICVDTAPLLERELADRAGIGFIGKNAMTIIPGVGSYVLLGALLLDVEVGVEQARTNATRCGDCTACLDGCPTDAFASPRQLDSRACIAYLTIELRGAIPRPLRHLIGNRVFGCDICQEVCPYNAKRLDGAPELAPRAELQAPQLEALLGLTASGYRRLVKGTALRRVTRYQIARNAAVALGNSGEAAVIPALARAATEHRNAMVRSHAAWALGRFDTPASIAGLRQALGDPDSDVVAEARDALAQSSSATTGA